MSEGQAERVRDVYTLSVNKPDGRQLILYGRAPITIDADSLFGEARETPRNTHFHWHPFRGEWVVYAGHRQHRTFLPPADFDPFAPPGETGAPSELPRGSYGVAVFENKFPSLAADPQPPPSSIVQTQGGIGAAEVVVYAQEAVSLAALPLAHLEVVLEALADRYRELGTREAVQYVMPFENRGVQVGMTLPHPHGQIYAYPFVPPIPASEFRNQHAYYQEHARGLLEDHLEQERQDGRRLLYAGDHVAAFVPVFARFAYEMWVAPWRPAPSLAELTIEERQDFARALKIVLLKLDALWSRALPSILIYHQAPTDGAPHPESHLHVECYPPHRAPDRLKYLGGCELGSGMFTADTLPEEKAAELRAVEVHVDA